MNRQTPGARAGQPLPAYRQAQTSQSPNAMYYATAGQQATQPRTGATPGGGAGAPGFPPMSGGIGRGGPPGFAARAAADPNDFPALGSQHAQQQQQQSLPPPHLSSSQSSYAGQTGMYSQQQQPPQTQQPGGGAGNSGSGSGGGGLAPPPPPPPGIGGPLAGTSPNQANGTVGGEDFPALGAGGSGGVVGGDKDRLASYLQQQPLPSRNPPGAGVQPQQQQHQQQQQPLPPSQPPQLSPQSTSAMPNGSHSASATPSTNPPHPQSNAGTNDSMWGVGGPGGGAIGGTGPVVRPVQQILQSPVDRWGLKALLYEIKTSMGKGDRGALMFGEELSELGVDVTSEDALYPTFVTPWVEPSQMSHPLRIEEQYHIPQCYTVVAPPVQSKISAFADDTLFYAFYASPGDVLQLEMAEELYNRGWRYHTEMQLWLTSPALQTLDPSNPPPPSPQHSADGIHWIRGPFQVFDPRTFSKHDTPPDFGVDATLLEATRPAAAIVGEQEALRKSGGSGGAAEGIAGAKSPSGNGR